MEVNRTAQSAHVGQPAGVISNKQTSHQEGVKSHLNKLDAYSTSGGCEPTPRAPNHSQTKQTLFQANRTPLIRG